MINLKNISRLAVVMVIAALIYYVKDTLFPVILSFILFYILNPLVTLLSQKNGKYRANINLSILFSFTAAGAAIFLFFRFVIPPLSSEFKHFGENLPAYVISIQNTVAGIQAWYSDNGFPLAIHNILASGFENLINTLANLAQSFTENIIKIAGQSIKIVMIPILTFYLLRDKETLKNGMLNLLPAGSREKSRKILTRINRTLHSYVKGIFTLCVIVGAFAALGLHFLGVKYAMVLGLIAGVTEAIPILGPWIGAIPAVIIALIASPTLALKVAALYLIIQVVENAILVPKVLGFHLNIHPVILIVAILVLGKFLGAWGLFFAAPIIAIANILYEELRT